EVSVFGFVADDQHLVPRGPGAAQEGINPLEHDRAADPAAVDRALQTLPRLFALRQSPDGPAQLVLAAAEIRTDPPALASERAEDLVVIDQGVVEIDPDALPAIRVRHAARDLG